MENIFLILAMAAVVVVLIFGIINLARGGGEEANKRSNKLMVWRVALQALVLAIVAIMAFALR